MAETEQTKDGPGSGTQAMSALSFGSGMILAGTIFHEAHDAITIQIGPSLFDVPRQFILAMKEIGEGSTGKFVELTVASNAQLIQRTIASPFQALAAGTPMLMGDGGGGGGACNCACACQCTGGGAIAQAPPVLGPNQPIFRTQIFRTY
jgi:hypothetical protein